MKVLIITNHYLDENNGGANCSKANIRALSELYTDCTLIYPEHNEKSSVNSIPHNIKAIPCFDHRSRFQKGIDIYRGILHRMPMFVATHFENNKYDLVVIDHSITANGVIHNVKKQCGKVVTIHHNNEAQYIQDNMPNLLYRWPYIYYARKAERDALSMSDLNIALTEKDARSFRKWYPNSNIHCYTMGTFQYQDLPLTIQDDGARVCKNFVITGSMNFQQSQRPIVEFVERYFPILLRVIPDANLVIAGRNPSENIRKVCSHIKQITLIPNPVDISKVVSQADIYVCPINTGSGVKLRVMDGLKLGLPILGHMVSLNGYETIKNDGFFFDYDDERSFEQALLSIVNLNYKKQQVYNSFLSYFGFESGKKRLQDILQKEKLL